MTAPKSKSTKPKSKSTNGAPKKSKVADGVSKFPHLSALLDELLGAKPEELYQVIAENADKLNRLRAEFTGAVSSVDIGDEIVHDFSVVEARNLERHMQSFGPTTRSADDSDFSDVEARNLERHMLSA